MGILTGMEKNRKPSYDQIVLSDVLQEGSLPPKLVMQQLYIVCGRFYIEMDHYSTKTSISKHTQC